MDEYVLKRQWCEQIGKFLEYPTHDFREELKILAGQVESISVEASNHLKDFLAKMKRMDIMRRVTRCCKLITTIALLSTSSTPANAGHFPEEQRPLPYITLSREQNPQILFPAHGLILNPTYDTNPNAEGLQVKGVGIAPLG